MSIWAFADSQKPVDQPDKTQASNPSSEKSSGNLILWGKVLDPQGKAVAGANVEWVTMFDFEQFASALSDTGGNVYCTEPQFRDQQDFVICRHPNFATWSQCHVETKQFKANKIFEIQLSEGPSLKVSIQSEDRKSLAGANVIIDRSVGGGDSCSHDYPHFEKLVSDDRGIASLGQLSPGSISCSVFKTGWVCFKKVKLQHGTTQKITTITLQKAQSFEVLMSFPSKQTPQKVMILCAFSANKIDDLPRSEGDLFGLPASQEATRTIQAPLKGYLSLKTSSSHYKEVNVLNIDLNKNSSTLVTLESLKKISGQVVDAVNGKGLDKATVTMRFTELNENYPSSRTVRTAKDGRFQMQEDCVGSVELKVWRQDFLPLSKSYDSKVVADNLLIALEQGERKTYRLLQPLPFGEPALIGLKKFNIQLITADDQCFELDKNTDQDGLCALTGLQNGDELEFRLEGYLYKKISYRRGSETEDLLFTTSAKAEIQVVDEKNNPLKDVDFYLSSNLDEPLSNPYDNSKKCFILVNLPEGKVKLKVKSHQYMDGELDFTAKIGVVVRKKIELKTKPTYTLTLKNFSGMAPENLDIQLGSDQYGNTYKSPTLEQGSQPPCYKWTAEDDDKNYTSLDVSVEGYIPFKAPFIIDIYNYEAELQKGESLEALVQDESGTPLEGVSVAYSCPEFKTNSNAASNAEGKVTLKGLIKSVYQINISKKSFAPQKITLDLSQEFQSPTWTLHKGGSLQVTVQNSQGQPVEGLKVTLEKSAEWGGYQQVYGTNGEAQKKTNKDGLANFDGLESGTYRTSVKDDLQGVGVSEECVFKQSETLTAQIALSEGLKLSGKILDEGRKPISKVEIHAYGGGNDYAQAKSDADGNFVLKGLKKGLCQVSLSHNDYECLAPQLQFEAGKEDLTLEMRKCRTISVLVKTPNNEAPKNVILYTRPEIDPYENLIDNAKEINGRYQFKSNLIQDLEMQSFRLIAKASGYNPGKSEAFTVETLPEQLEITLQEEKSIQFSIANAQGEAIMGASVQPSSLAQGMFMGGQSFASSSSDAKGNVTIKGLPEGEYLFSFRHSAYANFQQTFKVTGQYTLPHAITLSKGAILKGTVKDSQGEPLKGARIWILIKAGSTANPVDMVPQFNASSDDFGRYAIRNIPAGEGQVFFASRYSTNQNGQKPTRVTFLEGDTVNLDLVEPEVENAGRLEVILSEHWNEVFTGAHISQTATGSPMSFSGVKSKSSFVFEKVPEGSYSLNLWGQQGKFKSREVSITANKTTTVQIDQEENYKIIAHIVDTEGKPITQGQAVLMPAETAKNFMSNPYQSMAGSGTVHNGQLEVSLEQPGAYKLMLYVQNGIQMRTVALDTFNIQQEGTTDLGTITLKNGGQLQGVVQKNTGEFLSGVNLIIIKDGLPHFNPLWASDKNGSFTLKDVPETPFQLVVSHATMATLTLDVKDLSPLRLVMTLGVKVSIQLSGPKMADRSVMLVREDNTPLIDMTMLDTSSSPSVQVSNATGQVSIANIAQGRYKVCVAGARPEQNQYSDVFEVTSMDVSIQMALKD